MFFKTHIWLKKHWRLPCCFRTCLDTVFSQTLSKGKTRFLKDFEKIIELVRRVDSGYPRDLSRRQRKVDILCFRSVSFVFGCSRRAEMKEDNHIFRGKKSGRKIIFFSWGNLIFTFSKKYFSRQRKSNKKPMKKLMKIENFEISEIFRKNRKFEIFIFHWLFHRFLSQIFLVSKNIFFEKVKIKILHETILFFFQIFFSRKIWLSSFISARLEQPKTKITDRKHKMPTFFCLLDWAGTNSPYQLYSNRIERHRHLLIFGKFCDFPYFFRKNHKIFQKLEDGCAVLCDYHSLSV